MEEQAELVFMDRLKRALWYDVSPMRPDEFQSVELYPWIEAEDLQQAWRDGRTDAEDEHAVSERQRSA